MKTILLILIISINLQAANLGTVKTISAFDQCVSNTELTYHDYAQSCKFMVDATDLKFKSCLDSANIRDIKSSDMFDYLVVDCEGI
jgi:hypothetical protein